jgi:hypothetical protein
MALGIGMKEVLEHIQSMKSDEHLRDFARRNYGLEMVFHLKIAEDNGSEISITHLHKLLSEPKPTQIALRDFISFLQAKRRVTVTSSETKKNRKAVKLSPDVSEKLDSFVGSLYADIKSSP